MDILTYFCITTPFTVVILTGAFGLVQKGTLTDTNGKDIPVAIKAMKGNNGNI